MSLAMAGTGPAGNGLSQSQVDYVIFSPFEQVLKRPAAAALERAAAPSRHAPPPSSLALEGRVDDADKFYASGNSASVKLSGACSASPAFLALGQMPRPASVRRLDRRS